jgi:hypothetical protein
MNLQKTVIDALAALYHGTDDAMRVQADRWLQDFQHTIDAWQVLTGSHTPNDQFLSDDYLDFSWRYKD